MTFVFYIFYDYWFDILFLDLEGRLLNVDAISKEFSPEQSTPTTFIADVIKSFNWTSVSIVYDTSSGNIINSLKKNYFKDSSPEYTPK